MKMNIKNRLFTIAAAALLTLGVTTSCSDDDFGPSIFDTEEHWLDKTSVTFPLDTFCIKNFREPYNLRYVYKMEDIGSDMQKNLVPAKYEKSKELAVLAKYLWYESYETCAGQEFLKIYSPRIIHVIGSKSYNPVSGTETLGEAEGGLKITLYGANDLDVNDINKLNENFFKTMHHEFSHILHQTKTYPTEFQLLSPSWYSSTGWQDRYDPVCNSFGCVTNYASSETREDFAETIANYITKTDEQWDSLIYYAGRNWELTVDEKTGMSTYEDPEEIQDDEGGLADGVDGVAVINQKVQIARTWFRDAWGLDLDTLRAEVQRRQSNINIDSLRNLVYSIEKPQ